jgi:hypothetical protein
MSRSLGRSAVVALVASMAFAACNANPAPPTAPPSAPGASQPTASQPAASPPASSEPRPSLSISPIRPSRAPSPSP